MKRGASETKREKKEIDGTHSGWCNTARGVLRSASAGLPLPSDCRRSASPSVRRRGDGRTIGGAAKERQIGKGRRGCRLARGRRPVGTCGRVKDLTVKKTEGKEMRLHKHA
jgi:hypothetical protein